MKDEKVSALGARRHRLRLSAHDQQDPRGLPEGQGRQARGHHDQLHAVRPFRLADDRRRHQEVRLGRQEDRRRLDHQRRRQRAVLQGARQPGHQGEDIPVVAFSVGEEELAGIDTKPLVGHLAAWNYFQSIDTPDEQGVHREVAGLHQEPKRVTNDPMEAHVHRLQHVGEGGREGRHDRSRQGDRRAASASTVPNLTGGISKMLPNHHITKPVFIGEIQADGQFDVVWKTAGLVPGDAWSDYLDGSKDLIADWRDAEAAATSTSRPASAAAPRQLSPMRSMTGGTAGALSSAASFRAMGRSGIIVHAGSAGASDARSCRCASLLLLVSRSRPRSACAARVADADAARRASPPTASPRSKPASPTSPRRGDPRAPPVARRRSRDGRLLYVRPTKASSSRTIRGAARGRDPRTGAALAEEPAGA